MEQRREPMNKNRIAGVWCRTSQRQMVKSTSIKSSKRKSGGCAPKVVELTSGDLCGGPGIGTEVVVRRPDRSTEVSRRRIRQVQSVGSIEALVRKERNSQGSQDR